MGDTLVPGKAREAELERMMERYGDFLVGQCSAMLHDPYLAQDVVQETFIKAYEKLDTLRDRSESGERAWLNRIAVNLCRDQMRSKWFRLVDRNKPLDSLPELSSGTNERGRQLYDQVCALPRAQREVILLRYYQDLDVREIAAALGHAETTIYRRLKRALRTLKCDLERGDFHG